VTFLIWELWLISVKDATAKSLIPSVLIRQRKVNRFIPDLQFALIMPFFEVIKPPHFLALSDQWPTLQVNVFFRRASRSMKRKRNSQPHADRSPPSVNRATYPAGIRRRPESRGSTASYTGWLQRSREKINLNKPKVINKTRTRQKHESHSEV